MRYEVTRPNTTLKVGKKLYKSGDVFEAKKEEIQLLLDAKYIKEVKDGKAANK